MVLSLLVALSACADALGGTTVFYRVVSTQQTVIVGTEPDGTLTWTNTVPDSSCRVEQTYWLDGYWTTNFNATNLVATGRVMRTQVPVPLVASNGEICVHNLHLIWQAMERKRIAEERMCGDPVTINDLYAYGLPNPLPPCPDGGTYSVSTLCTLPTCTIAGHKLPDPW